MMKFLRERIWAHLPTEVTFRQRVIAAALWGGVVPVVYALVWWWRHRAEADVAQLWTTTGIVGGAIALAVLAPGFGRHFYLGVLRVFSIVGWIVSNVALIAIYYVIVTPVGLVLRIVRRGDAASSSFKSGAPPQWDDYGGDMEPRRYYRLS